MLNLDPDVNVGFLLHDVSRMMRNWFDARAQAMGLTRAQWRVLVHLGPRPGINQRRLAEILEIENVTLSRHIDRLEAAGWVERRRDPSDRRAWQLHLSEAARPTIEAMGELAVETQAQALSGLSEDDRAALIAMLIRIKSNMAEPEAPAAAAE